MKKVKQKKKSKLFIAFSVLLSLVLIALAGLFLYQLMGMNILPNKIFIPLSIAIGLFSLIFIILLFFYTKHFLSKFFVSLLVIALCVGTGMGNYYLYKTANAVQKITTHEKKVKNTISIIAKASSNIDGLEDLTGKKVAKLKTIDTEGTKNAIKQVRKELEIGKKEDLPFTEKNANSVQEAVQFLYADKVDAVILNEAYRANVVEIEDFQDFSEATKVIYQAVYYTDDTNEALAVSDITSQPFNILVSGNDTYGDVGEELSRSDVNMVVTVNPLTSTVLLTSIPRDSYVMTVCDATDICAYGGMDKLTHTGIHGVNVTKRTVENMLDIEINYTFRANFSSVVDIVDAIGGIDIEVPEGMAVSKFYANSNVEGVHEGLNHLDGERALSFARERKAYLDGDNQRVRNQQTVLKAIFEKGTSPAIITKYAKLLDALSNTFETNLSANEITDLIKFQIQTMTSWNFENYQVAGYGDMLVCAESGQELSVIVPYDEAVQIAHDKIQAVLDGESSSTVEDTFDATKSQGALSSEEIEAQINADLYGGYIDYGYVPQYDYTYDPGYEDQTTYDPEYGEGGQEETGYGDGYYTDDQVYGEGQY